MTFHVRSIASGKSGARTRLGRLTISRENSSPVELSTPTLWTYTSRGVVPHLTRDNVLKSPAIKGIHIPLES